jgi:hypothetical protein
VSDGDADSREEQSTMQLETNGAFLHINEIECGVGEIHSTMFAA